MPFTFSHPAIVLPFTFFPRKYISTTGLVIGSIIPDFEYFLRMKIQSDYSHTLSGLLVFDLPMGVLAAFLFHNIVRDQLFKNLPKFLRSRLLIFKQFDWNTYFKTCWFTVFVSVLIGASSHIIWDSFTHEHAYFVQTTPLLNLSVTVFNHQIPVFKIAQHLSSCIGFIIIAFAISKLPVNNNATPSPSLKYWSVFFLLALVVASIRILLGLSFQMIGHIFVTGISAFMISLVLTPLLLKIEKRLHN